MQHMVKKMIFHTLKKETFLKLCVRYMSAAVLRENRKLQEQVIKMMAMSYTPPTMKCIKRLLMKKIPVISLIMFYEQREKSCSER